MATHVSRLRIENLGKFEDLTLELKPFTVLVGPNDAGKSTALRAFKLVGGRENLDEDEVRRISDTDLERAEEVRITAWLQDPSNALAEQCNLFEDDDAGFRITWDVSQDGDDVNISSPSFEFYERVPKTLALWEFPKYADDQRLVLKQVGIHEGGEEPPGSNEEERREQWLQEKKEALQEKANTFLKWQPADRKDYLKYTPPTNALSAEEISEPKSLISNFLERHTVDIVYPEEAEGERTRIDSLRELEQDVESQLNEQLENLTPRIKRHVSDVEEIKVSPEWDFVRGADFSDVRIVGEHGVLPLDEWGAGSKAKAAMGILEWEKEDSSDADASLRFRTMDEPDHRLHFDSQRKLIALVREDVADEASSLNQCVIATHSLVIVDTTPIDEVLYLPLDLGPGAEIKPLLDKDEATTGELLGNIKEGLGLPASWAYLEKAILIVEGPTDYNYIRGIYADVTGATLVEDGVRVWDAQGVGHIGRTVERLHEEARAKVFVALDSDAREKEIDTEGVTLPLEEFFEEELDSTDVDRTHAWLGSKELEDAWSADDLASLANEKWPKPGEAEWEPGDFHEIGDAEKPSQKLSSLLAAGCADNLENFEFPSKARIGTQMGRIEGVDHPPPLVELLRSVHSYCEEDYQ